MSATNYFEKLSALLKIEREEDLAQYRQLTEFSSAADRRSSGITWYPIAIRGTEIGRGDYLTVEIERTSHQDIASQFRSGSAVGLFSNHDAANDRVEGTLTYANQNKLKIALKTDELPDWARNGKLGVDLLFDNNSYNEMEQALRSAVKLVDQGKNNRLVDVLIHRVSPTFNAELPLFQSEQLNAQQTEAVNRVLQANELAIIHGPPGTGKTTTLIQAIQALVRQDRQQILVVAPSNTAVDLLTEKLAMEGLNVVRIGNPSRVSDRLSALTLDGKMSGHPAMKEVRSLRKQANAFKDMAHKYKRNFGRSERDQRKALFDEAHIIMKTVDDTVQYISNDILTKADVITATLVGANHYTIKELKYHTLVIDEAAQALEPACWIPILKAQKLVMAGDHCQLPPTIKSFEAAKSGLAHTLFEKCTEQYPEAVVLLAEQYRMHELIMAHSSQHFYEGKLRAHPSVAHHLLFPEDWPMEFIDTAGCGFDEQREGASIRNPEEAEFLLKHLTQFSEALRNNHQAGDFPSMAIISPYKQQVQLIRELLEARDDLKLFGEKIAVNTIDGFQGQERDVVYISLTRSNTEGVIGFLADIRRMNVAMTRARKKLVMIGDSATLSHSSFYSGLIAFAEENKAYKSAWEYVDE